MNLILGIILIFSGIGIGYLTYLNVVRRNKFTMTWGGFNLVTFASILLVTGIYIVSGL